MPFGTGVVDLVTGDLTDAILVPCSKSAARNETTLGAIKAYVLTGAGGTWGSITGTLSAQTDLQSALDAKQPLDAALTALAAGSDFVQFTGPTTAIKSFTLPDASAVILYSGGPLGTPASGVATNLTGTAAGLTAGALTPSPALTGTPTAPTAAGGTNTTQIATTAFVTDAVGTAVTGLLEFKGSTDCSSNPNYPAASKGDAYLVSVAGKIGGASGTAVDVGDMYVAIADNAGGTQAAVGTSWTVLEHNLAGALLSANNLSDVANAGTARTNLGVGTGDSPQFTAINLGHASDSTLTRSAAGKMALEGKAVPLMSAAIDAVFAGPTAARTYTLPDADSTLVATGAITGSGLTMATARILGRTTASTGAIEEITIGSGLSLSAGSLTATGSGVQVGDSPTWTGIHTFTPGARSSGSAAYLTVNAPADTGLTASTEAIGINFAGATRQHATGAITTQREVVFSPPTYSFVGASTITTAATVAIPDAPSAGTNATITNKYAFWVQAGGSRFDGNVGINIAPDSAGATALQVLGPANQYAQKIFGSATSGQSYGLQIAAGSTSADTCALFAAQSGNQYFRVRGDGLLYIGTAALGFVIGHTAQLAVGGNSNWFEQFGTSAATTGMSLGAFSATQSVCGHFDFYKSANGSIGSATVVANGESLGTITWYGAQQTGTFATQNPAAQIRAEIDAAVTSGAGADMPGRIILATTPNASGTLADRLTIDNAGNVVLGTAALATSATDGFLYIPTCAGAPSGTPTTKTGRCAMVYDTTNNKLYVYNGAWKGVTLA